MSGPVWLIAMRSRLGCKLSLAQQGRMSQLGHEPTFGTVWRCVWNAARVGCWHETDVQRCPLGLPLSAGKPTFVTQCPVFGRLLPLDPADPTPAPPPAAALAECVIGLGKISKLRAKNCYTRIA